MKSFYLESDIQEIYEKLLPHQNYINNKRFLICGGNGFLGKYFTAVLDKFNTQIVVVDQTVPEHRLPNVMYCKGDITQENIFDFFRVEFDYILAGASIASPKIYKQYPLECLDVGYQGVKNCLNQARIDKAKLLYFSSSEVYQTADIIPTPESYVGAIPSNSERSCYDISKLVGETLVHYYVQQYNVNATTVVPFNFWGPQANDFRVMPAFMYSIINNRPLQVFNGGTQTRSYTYITDGIVGCLLTLLFGEPGEKYNIGNPKNTVSVKQLADDMIYYTDSKCKIEIIDYPKDYAGSDPIRRMPDISKAKNKLGFDPEISLLEGINRFYSWAKENYKNE